MGISTLFINAVISGIILGSLYSVMSMGLTIIYGVGRIFNFVQGAFVLWGGYFAWLFSVEYKFNYVLSFVLAVAILFILGWVIDRSMLFPLRKKPNFGINSVLVTLGLAIVMCTAGDVIFGTRFKTIDKLVEGVLKIGKFTVTYHDISIFVIAVGLLLLIEICLRKTILGMALRAISQDPVGARIVGINFDRLYALTLAIAAALGAISGILLAPRYFIAPVVGWETLFKAVIIVIFGGLGSLRGTLVSAFALGILESFVSAYIGMFWVSPMWFILLILVLFVRPKGLFGKWA